MKMADSSYDLVRTTLAVQFIVGLTAASFLVLQPFHGATVWAATLVVATWPLLSWLEAALGGRGWAVVVMTLILLLLAILPLSLAISAVVSHADVIAALPDAVSNFRMPPPPAWLADIPLIGAPPRKSGSACLQTAPARSPACCVPMPERSLSG
jgi:predicted PurR-regulated permease PerM